MLLSIEHEGRKTVNITADEALEMGYPTEVIEAAEAAALSLETRGATRKKIEQAAGDPLSLIGTTADAAAIATLGIAAMTVALSNSGNYTEFKTAFLATLGQFSPNGDMVQISEDFLAKIGTGEVIIPAMVKGLGDVISDIETRSTAVAQALIAAAPPQE